MAYDVVCTEQGVPLRGKDDSTLSTTPQTTRRDKSVRGGGRRRRPRRVHDELTLSLYYTPCPPLTYKREETAPAGGALSKIFLHTCTRTHLTGLDIVTQPELLRCPDQMLDQHNNSHTRDLGRRSLSRPFVSPYCKLMHDTRAAANWK